MYAAIVRQLGVPIAGAEIRPMERTRLIVEVTKRAIEQPCQVVTGSEQRSTRPKTAKTLRLA